MAKLANCYGNQNSFYLKPCLVNITNDSCGVMFLHVDLNHHSLLNKFADHVVTKVSKVIQNFPETDVKAGLLRSALI